VVPDTAANDHRTIEVGPLNSSTRAGVVGHLGVSDASLRPPVACQFWAYAKMRECGSSFLSLKPYPVSRFSSSPRLSGS